MHVVEVAPDTASLTSFLEGPDKNKGGLVAHTLPVPNEWKGLKGAVTSHYQDLVPWIRRVGCTLTVGTPDAGTTWDWEHLYPFLAVLRVETTGPAAGSADVTVQGVTIFEPLDGGEAVGGLTLRLDSMQEFGRAVYNPGAPQLKSWPTKAATNNAEAVDPTGDTDLLTYHYVMVAGFIKDVGEGGVPGRCPAMFGVHSGWCEYCTPEVLAGF
jgi:hypothetical protein